MNTVTENKIKELRDKGVGGKIVNNRHYPKVGTAARFEVRAALEMGITLTEGQVFDSYKELCSFLNINTKGSRDRKFHILELERHYKFERVGNKIVVKDVYDKIKSEEYKSNQSILLKRDKDIEFKERVYELVGNEYSFLSKYTNPSTRVLCKHNKCGHEWMVYPYNILRGSRCPICSKEEALANRSGVTKKKTNAEFLNEVCKLVGNEYTFLEEYVSSQVAILCKHNECGYEWKVKPNHFINNDTRCPQCLLSKGEDTVRKFLESMNIKFTQEYSIDGLVGIGGKLLRFDFAIFNNNGDLGLLVEYDGEFHFHQYYEEQNFKEIQIHDKSKNEYCEDNNIPLLRIPYWEFDNIGKILANELNKRWGGLFE